MSGRGANIVRFFTSLRFWRIIARAGRADQRPEGSVRGSQRSVINSQGNLIPTSRRPGRRASAASSVARSAAGPASGVAPRRGRGRATPPATVGQSPDRTRAVAFRRGGVEGLRPSTNRLAPARGGRAMGVAPGRLAAGTGGCRQASPPRTPPLRAACHRQIAALQRRNRLRAGVGWQVEQESVHSAGVKNAASSRPRTGTTSARSR